MKTGGPSKSVRVAGRFRLRACAAALALLTAAAPQSAAQPSAAARAAQEPSEPRFTAEPFCGGEIASGQQLVKVRGCPRRTNLRRLMRRLKNFLNSSNLLNAFTGSADLTLSQVGRGHVFLIKSSQLNAADFAERARFDVTLRNIRFWPNSSCEIDHFEPNFVVRADGGRGAVRPATEPDDDFFQQHRLWGLRNMGFAPCSARCGCCEGKQGFDVGAVQAWRITRGSRRIVVGVLDNGVDYRHEDLARNIWSAPRSFSTWINGVPIRCPKGSHGFNALDMSDPCKPLALGNSHGTHVAGIIGAEGGNGRGAVGVNWRVRLLPLRFMSAGRALVSDAISAMDFLLFVKQRFKGRADVRVLNNSWGYRHLRECESELLREKVAELGQKGILFVASAGNDGKNNDESPHYPSNYNLPNLLAVTAIDNLGRLAKAANGASYGSKTVHLGAPGATILSTCVASDLECVDSRPYCYLGGTSMAAPHAAGAAALVLSVRSGRCSGLSAAGLRDLLLASTVRTDSLAETISGGRLNVYEAIRKCRAAR